MRTLITPVQIKSLLANPFWPAENWGRRSWRTLASGGEWRGWWEAGRKGGQERYGKQDLQDGRSWKTIEKKKKMKMSYNL